MSYIEDSDYLLETAKGNTGDTAFSKYGWNRDIDSGSGYEIIASFGGTWAAPTAGVATFSSSVANDTSAGTGARTLLISGVDNSGELATETITLNGLTGVSTTTSWRGINRVTVESAGSSGFNEGNITGTIGGTTQAYIESEVSVTQQCIFFVPDTHDSYILQLIVEVDKVSGGGVPKVDFRLHYVLNGVDYQPIELVVDASINVGLHEKFKVPFKIPAGSYWYLVGDTDTNNTFVRGRIEQVISPI